MLGNSKIMGRRSPQLFLFIFCVFFLSTIYWLRPFQSSGASYRIPQTVDSSKDASGTAHRTPQVIPPSKDSLGHIPQSYPPSKDPSETSHPIPPVENHNKDSSEPIHKITYESKPSKETSEQHGQQEEVKTPTKGSHEKQDHPQELKAPSKDFPGQHSDSQKTDSSIKDTPKSKPHSTDHPIKQFHQAAVKQFESRLSSQSKSLEEATKEYKRRYKRSPPLGFDGWYDFAVKHNSAVIDDFDLINDNMKPLWSASPSAIRELMETAMKTGPFIQSLTIESGNFTPSKENWMGERIRDLSTKFSIPIPDLKILMNPLDEPRILMSGQPSKKELEWVERSQHSAYAAIIESCKPSSKATSHEATGVDRLGFPFMKDITTMQDVCSNPEYESKHGFMIGPTHLTTTDSPLPILSQARLSTFSDIVYPSMWYWDHEMHDLEEFDVEWKEKRNKLYWSGKTTGGTVRMPEEGEKPFESQRHRFINITRQIKPTSFDFLTRDQVGHEWTKYSSEEVLSQLYQTKFTGVVQCEGEGDFCDEMGKQYKLEEPDDSKVAFRYRFLMDLDGNTFSGRFYNLLASNSCPLKQAIFQEWHDERLMAWVHYIPISVGMQELPETMRYLALTSEGNEIAQQVAQAGKEWNKKMLRQEDAAIYMYRLLLEYARVMSDDRDQKD